MSPPRILHLIHHLRIGGAERLLGDLMPALAAAGQTETGNGCPSGAHYNLNLIGMAHAKNVDPNAVADDGHRIFVQLGSKDSAATTKISLVQGEDFAVLDYDGTDGSAMTIWFQVIAALL